MEMSMERIDSIKAILLSIFSSFKSSLSLTARGVAYMSYLENLGHFSLLFLKIAFLISSIFSLPILSESQLPQKHFIALTREMDGACLEIR
jgi:Na+-driven multidrug efflux pump